MPVIALTGGTGFIGRALVARLLVSEPDFELRALVRGRGRLSNAPTSGHLHEIEGSLADPDALRDLVEGADAVVHLAGAIAGSCAEDFDEVNVGGSERLAAAIEQHAPGAHAVLVSSLAASRPELSWYAASKAGAEQAWNQRLAERSSVLRPPAVYGPDDPALADFWKSLARGWLIRLGPADARFSLVHVDDVVEALLRLIHHGPTSATMTLSGPQPDGGWRWSDVAAVADRVRGRPVHTAAIPAAVLALAGRTALLANRLRGRPALLSPGKVRELRHVDWVCDNLALSARLDWQPTTRLERAIATLPGWNRA